MNARHRLIVLALALLAALTACGAPATPGAGSGGVGAPSPTATATAPAPATVTPMLPPSPSLTAAPSAPPATPVPPTALPTTAAPPPATVTPPAPTATAPPATATPAATATPVASATPGIVRYTAQPGDTLFAIALAYGVTVDQLMAVNGLTNRNLLYAGQVLVIPGPGVVIPPSPTPAATDTPAATETPTEPNLPGTPPPLPPDGTLITYMVQPGDGLFAIARRFNTTTDAIAARNRLDNINYIMSGEVLTIMIGDKTSRPTPAATATPVPANTPVPPGADPGLKWIDVDISSQMLRAYEGTTEVFSSAVSTGVASHPTVLGTFHIYAKLLADDMRGGVGADAYYLPDVPYTMYFYTGGYALHGTYWHHNFGHPMSHGCVNLPTPAAKWLFNWAPLGTTVKIHQ